MAISRAQLLKELLPGLNALFGLEYKRYGEEHKEVYETEIKTYTISYKKESCGKGGCIYYIYFQTPTSTERAMVNYDTYSRYEVGQKIQVLIKYWEKPKKK